MNRRRVLGLLLATCVAAVAGCSGVGSSGNGKVTLQYWVYQSTGPDTFDSSLVKAFEKAHPNINVEVTQYPYQSYDVKVQTAIAAHNAPDLILAFNLDFMRRGFLLPLGDMVRQYHIDISHYNQAIIKGPGNFACSLNGKLYCLGATQGGWAIFYNKKMFRAAGIPYPKAWPPMPLDYFANIACRLTNKANKVWGAAVPSDVLPFSIMVSPNGRTVKGYLDSPATIHDISVLSSIVRNGCSPTANVIDPWDESADYFARGAIAMAVCDLDSAKQFEKAGIDYGVTGPPTPPGVTPHFDVYSDNTGVLASSEHPKEAEEFLAFLTTRGQRIAYTHGGSIPIDNIVARQINWAQGIPGREDALKVLVHSTPPVFLPPTGGDVWGPYYDAWNYMISGQKSTRQALEDAIPAIQQNLDKAWQIWNNKD
jgi:multiple sugar transport system substrate-binding protein